MDYSELGRQLLDETVLSLKGEYAKIPQTVKDAMPRAAMLVAKGLVGLTDNEQAACKYAMALLGSVKVGGQLALSELMLQTFERVLGAALGALRKLIGL